MIDRNELVQHLDTLLEAQECADYCPNGLQVEGRAEIRRVALGVTACQALLDKARAFDADAVLVHHGLFWGDAAGTRIERSLRARVATLIESGMNLLAYHLPLDRHPELGNNAVLAARLGAIERTPAFPHRGTPVGLIARLPEPVPADAFFARVAAALGRDPLVVAGGPSHVERFGLVTGRDTGSCALAARLGLDAYLTGEPGESIVHLAREEGLHLVAAGHHATERFGVQALGAHLEEKFGLSCRYFEIGNPV